MSAHEEAVRLAAEALRRHATERVVLHPSGVAVWRCVTCRVVTDPDHTGREVVTAAAPVLLAAERARIAAAIRAVRVPAGTDALDREYQAGGRDMRADAARIAETPEEGP